MIGYISVHHTGGTLTDPYASGIKTTLEDIDSYHKQRWSDFRSKLGYWVGYNIVIRPDGSFVQTRLIGEEGAHTKGFNLSAVGICLIGNFTKGVDTPTIQQKMTLKNLIKCLLSKRTESMGLKTTSDCVLDIQKDRIFPHRRFFPANTSCFGDSLSETWAQELLEPYSDKGLIAELISEVKRLLSVLDTYKKKKKLGYLPKSCLFGDDVRG